MQKYIPSFPFSSICLVNQNVVIVRDFESAVDRMSKNQFKCQLSSLVFPAIDGMRCKYSSYTEQHLVQRVSFCSKVAKQDARFCCWFLIPHLRKTKEKGIKSAAALVYSALFVPSDAVRAYVCVTFFGNALMRALWVVPITHACVRTPS